jgi:hypothetical protein
MRYTYLFFFTRFGLRFVVWRFLGSLSSDSAIAISTYFSSFSIPIKFRLVFIQATAVVPDPIVKSKTVSFSSV